MTPDLHKSFADFYTNVNSTVWEAANRLYDANMKITAELFKSMNTTDAFGWLKSGK